MLNDSSYDEDKIADIESKIELFLKEYKRIYPSNNITAKHHFMVHYGRSIRTYGPPCQYSTMRFELKHGRFRQYERAIHNHINLGKSLAVKHQDSQVYHLTSQNYFSTNDFGTLE